MCKWLSNVVAVFVAAIFVGTDLNLFSFLYNSLFAAAPAWVSLVAPWVFSVSIAAGWLIYFLRNRPASLAARLGVCMAFTFLAPCVLGFVAHSGLLDAQDTGAGLIDLHDLLGVICIPFLLMPIGIPVMAFFSGRYTVAAPADSASAH
jgi:hypothetical protein